MFSLRNTTFKSLNPNYRLLVQYRDLVTPLTSPQSWKDLALALFHWGRKLTATQVAHETRTLEGVT